MKIINQDNFKPKPQKPRKEFTCYGCGNIFIADGDEYECIKIYTGNNKIISFCVSKCPLCGTITGE